MSEITVITNGHPRDLLSSYEVNDKIAAKLREEFDYIKDDEWFEDCIDRFFQYKGQWYDVNDFQFLPKELLSQMKWWDGYQSDTFFSGILVKYAGDDFDQVVVGRYYS